ncbi:MAG: DNA alkylation repair enzyme [Rikenellaceae bacterium]
MGNTERFTKLLGECRRQMNGAIVGSMRYYGTEYGLNYGVSLPTIRSLAKAEGHDHCYAKYLYQQQVREIRLASLHIASPELVSSEELDFWAAGIINSEVAEEASFALFQYVDAVTQWLSSENELLIYTALLSISKSKKIEVVAFNNLISKYLHIDSLLLNNAIIILLESYYRNKANRIAIDKIIADLPTSKSSSYIIEEMTWRKKCL